MKSYVSIMKTLVLGAVLIAGFISCEVASNNSGQLSLSLTDKPTHDFQEVWVTIEDIAVHAEDDPEDSWYTILNVHETIELTSLVDGMRKELGIVNLDPGHYTQMRIMIGENPIDHTYANFVVDSKGDEYPLKIPSGVQTGIKLVHGFDINANSTTELTFDFDASRSIVVAGKSGKYILKPVIHTIDDSEVRTIIQGTVKTMEDAPLAMVNVSLQIYNPMSRPPAEGQDLKDEVTVWGSTLTDAEGAYMYFFLDLPDPENFNLVAAPNWNTTEADYVPGWDQILGAVNGGSYVRDFVLPVPSEVGTLSLKAIVVDEDDVQNIEPETVVTVSIRQVSDLVGPPLNPIVEVNWINIVGHDNDEGYSFADFEAAEVALPVGSYKIVAWTAGRVTLEQDISITAAGPNEIEFTFELPTT